MNTPSESQQRLVSVITYSDSQYVLILSTNEDVDILLFFFQLLEKKEKIIETKHSQNGGPHPKLQISKSHYRKKSCLRAFWACLTGTKSEPPFRQRNLQSYDQMNSVSKIDRVSRIMFPAVFLMLNTIYWSCYG